MPFDYVRLPLAVVLGMWMFEESIDPPVWLGAGIIAASSLYITYRERRLAQAHHRLERSLNESSGQTK
jgi:drug/metabolite transporter (DMT)-like permease